MKLKYLIVFGLFISLSSCTSRNSNSEVSREEVKEIVKNPETILVDVRIPEQFSEKTVEGAMNIPLAKIEENLDFLRKQKNIVVFCNSGRQSSEAMEILKKNGITNVYNAKNVQNVNAIKKEKK